ncbi:MAG: hypothetical protein ACRCW0_04830 [Clostridium sp.]|nr:hypothetical protein KD33_11620 [Clostridium sp. NCR]
MKVTLQRINETLKEITALCIAVTFLSMILRHVALTKFEIVIMCISLISIILRYIILIILKLKK